MAAAKAAANQHIVSNILYHLRNQKIKERRQRGPDHPVELVATCPSLLPALTVNKLWADAGTSIIWSRYPRLPALRDVESARRQQYADKVTKTYLIQPQPDEDLDYLSNLKWPLLSSVELVLDFAQFGPQLMNMFTPSLHFFALGSPQSCTASHFIQTILPTILALCPNLQGFNLGPGIFPTSEASLPNELCDQLDVIPSIKAIQVKHSGISDDLLFSRLSRRVGLLALQIDLVSGSQLLPLFESTESEPPFASLQRLDISCSPENALAMLPHLPMLENLQVHVRRTGTESPQDSDKSILGDLLTSVASASNLRVLSIIMGAISKPFAPEVESPVLSGPALVELARNNTKLKVLKISPSEPQSIDGSAISTEDFELFCSLLPHLEGLTLKFDPETVQHLTHTILESLGQHCRSLHFIRLRMSATLPGLPISNTTPRITLDAPVSSSPDQESWFDKLNGDTPSSTPLFPCLAHLAIARPDTILAFPPDSSSEHLDQQLKEYLVRSWADALLADFPRLEILEAWGDWIGNDAKSLNYLLPTQGVLHCMWEFLRGIEQDIWVDEEEEEEGASDWDVASGLNELVSGDEG